jgi:hypothetical protein
VRLPACHAAAAIFFVGVVGTRDAALKAAIKEVIPGAEVIVEPVRISNGVATVVYQTQNGELVQATFDAFKVIYMIAGTLPGLQAMGIVGPPAQDCLQAALWLTQQAGQKLGTDLRTRILKCPEGRVLNGAGKCEPKPRRIQTKERPPFRAPSCASSGSTPLRRAVPRDRSAAEMR